MGLFSLIVRAIFSTAAIMYGLHTFVTTVPLISELLVVAFVIADFRLRPYGDTEVLVEYDTGISILLLDAAASNSLKSLPDSLLNTGRRYSGTLVFIIFIILALISGIHKLRVANPTTPFGTAAPAECATDVEKSEYLLDK